MNNRVQKICKICYFVVVVLTFILWCVLAGIVFQIGQSVDVPLVAYVGCAILFFGFFIAMIHEFVFYISIRYFLSGREHKTRKKNLIYGAAFFINLFVLCKEIIYIASMNSAPW